MESKKINILCKIFGNYHRSGKEYLFKCPKCNHHKNKLSINLDRGVFKCWVCDFSGKRISFIVNKYGSSADRSSWSEFEPSVEITDFDDLFAEKVSIENTVSLPAEFRTLSSNISTLYEKRAKHYLYNRGLTDKDILRWKVGFCASGEFSGRIIVPSFDEDGEVDYFIARSIRDEWPKYKNPPVSRNIIFNELMIDWSSDLVLVEGVFDAIKAGNAIPILGSNLTEKSKLFQKIVKKKPRLYLALDKDVEAKSFEIIKKFLEFDIIISKIELGAAKDVGEMSKEEFLHAKENASFIESDDYLFYKALTL